MRFFEFKSVELVHIGVGSANISSIAEGTLFYANDHGKKLAIDLVECARIHECLSWLCSQFKTKNGRPGKGGRPDQR